MTIVRRKFLGFVAMLGGAGALFGTPTLDANAATPAVEEDDVQPSLEAGDSTRASVHIVSGAVGTGVAEYARLLAAPVYMYVNMDTAGPYPPIRGFLKVLERDGGYPSVLVVDLGVSGLAIERERLPEVMAKFRKIIIPLTSTDASKVNSLEKILTCPGIHDIVQMADHVTFTTTVKNRLSQI